MPLHLLEIEGHRLAAETFHDDRPGPPVVLIHGITASIDFWAHSLPPQVRDESRWISLSLPGHFPSRLPPGLSPADFTEELFFRLYREAILRLAEGVPVVLVGWSTGGFAALNLAAREPALVDRVLSICGFATGCWGGLVGVLQRLAKSGRWRQSAFLAGWRQLVRHRWLFDRAIAQAAANRSAFWSSPVTRSTLDGWHAAVRQHDAHDLRLLFSRLVEFDIRPLIAGMSVPTLIVGGDRDPYIPVEHTRWLAQAIPGAELHILERTGHMFFAESTEAYQRLLTRWLGREFAASRSAAPSDPLLNS